MDQWVVIAQRESEYFSATTKIEIAETPPLLTSTAKFLKVHNIWRYLWNVIHKTVKIWNWVLNFGTGVHAVICDSLKKG